jgi:hypothetical protein
MAGANLVTCLALERGKSQHVLSFVPENELHARGAEAARAVVQQKRLAIA